MSLAVCTISGTVQTPAGVAVQNAMVRYRILTPLDSAIHVTVFALTTWTASDGTWSVTLAQGATARIEIPSAGIDEWGEVPNASTATAEDVFGDWQEWEL